MGVQAVRERIKNIYHEIAGLLHASARQLAGRKPWAMAFIDERFEPSGSGVSLGRCRVQLKDGTWLTDIDPPRGSAVLSLEAFDLRTAELPEKERWYGVLVTVYPDGRCEVAFDYDPDCLSKMPTKT